MAKVEADAAHGMPKSQTRGEPISVDFCIIGAGSGGLSLAAAAAAFGQKVVLIEKHKMGGDCLNYGCVPSKALIAAGKRAHIMRTSAPFGIQPVEPRVDPRGVHEHVHSVIEAIARMIPSNASPALACASSPRRHASSTRRRWRRAST